MEKKWFVVLRKTNVMKSILCILTLAILFSCTQNNEPKTINVTGQAKMKIVPDMVELSLRAYSVKPAMKDAVTESSIKMMAAARML